MKRVKKVLGCPVAVRLSISCVAAIVLPGCGISHHVQRVRSVAPASEPGIYYHLPETILRVAIPVKKTTTEPGTLGVLPRYTR